MLVRRCGRALQQMLMRRGSGPAQQEMLMRCRRLRLQQMLAGRGGFGLEQVLM